LDKAKNENKNLKNKLEIGVGGNSSAHKNEEINYRGSANNFFVGNNLNSSSNKILIELLNGQNAIKDYIKDIMDKTNELYESNNNSYKSSKNVIRNIGDNYIPKEINTNYNSKTSSKHKSSNNLDYLRKKEKLVKEIPKKEYIDYSTFNNTAKIPSNNNILLNNTIPENIINIPPEIKISNSVLKKDLTGKPFIEYICNVKNGSDTYSINKKFGHFLLLHKTLKNLLKDSVALPESGNLFININDMKQNSFHENKLGQLDKYINELIKIEQVLNCLTFRSFFELDKIHDIGGIKKTRTLMGKRAGKFSSNTLQKNLEDFQI
jgi:hypothetical protein